MYFRTDFDDSNCVVDDWRDEEDEDEEEDDGDQKDEDNDDEVERRRVAELVKHMNNIAIVITNS